MSLYKSMQYLSYHLKQDTVGLENAPKRARRMIDAVAFIA